MKKRSEPMRPQSWLGLLGLAATTCGGGPESPSLHSQTIAATLSSVGTMAADFRTYPVTTTRPGVLTASVQWAGEGALWLFLFDEQPPTTHAALAQSDQARPANPAAISASVVGGRTYFVLVMQSIVPAGPARGSCGCTDDFTLTLTYP